MKKLELFCNIKIKENLQKDDPSDKILQFSISLSTPENKDKTIVFTNDCFLNYTSNSSGIIEIAPNQEDSFKSSVSNTQGTNSTSNTRSKLGLVTFSDLASNIKPENFLFYDDKNLFFMLSQIYIEGFIDSTGNYITLGVASAKTFFEKVCKSAPDILKNILPKLSEDDTIEIIAN